MCGAIQMFFLNYIKTIFFLFPFPFATFQPHAGKRLEQRNIARGVTLIILLILVGTLLASYSIGTVFTILSGEAKSVLNNYIEIIKLLVYGIGIFIGAHLVSVGLASLNRALRGDVD